MKYLSLLAVILVFISCEKDPGAEYPKLYTFSHVNIDEGDQFVVNNDNTASGISLQIGTFGNFYDTLEQFVVNGSKASFFIEEIELLSEDMLRLEFIVENTSYDTTSSYTLEDEVLVISALGNSNLFSYDNDSDAFELCLSVVGAINGPNPIVDPTAYFLNVQECTLTREQHLSDLLTNHNYEPGDTIGIYLPRLVYE